MSGIDQAKRVSQIGFNRPLDFCVWILQHDGLKAPPFTHHPHGNGRIQAPGLDADGWSKWVDLVAGALHRRLLFEHGLSRQFAPIAEMWEHGDEGAEGRIHLDFGGRLAPLVVPVRVFRGFLRARSYSTSKPRDVPYPNPADLWPADGPLRREIAGLWRRYMRSQVSDRRRYWKAQSLRMYFTTPRFESFALHVRSMRTDEAVDPIVSFVYYPWHVVLPTNAPVTIIGTRNWSASADEFERIVLTAAQAALTPPAGA